MALARVEDRQAVLNAAEAAIAEAEAKVVEMEATDDLFAELQRGEAEQLRRSLELVIPELRFRGCIHSGRDVGEELKSLPTLAAVQFEEAATLRRVLNVLLVLLPSGSRVAKRDVM